MPIEKKQYKVLVAFEMGKKKYDVGQEIELDPEKTKTLMENGAIEALPEKGNEGPSQPVTTPPAVQSKKDDESSLVRQLQQQIEDMKGVTDMLLQTADKKLLSKYYATHQKKMPKEFRLNVFNGKVIVLRRDMPANNVGKNPATKQWFEDQMVELVLEDDEVLRMTYQSSLAYTQVPAKLISSQVDEMTDEVICKLVRLDNNKEYNINLKYLN